MPDRILVEQQQESLVKQAQPVLHVLAMLCAVLIWSYNTFALKESISELKTTVAQVEVRCNQYSDNNRHRMEERVDAILIDIRDQLGYLRNMIKKM